MKVNLYIPTLNAGGKWKEVLKKIQSQTYPISLKVIMDSGSEDGTLMAETIGDYEIILVDKRDFDHGGTRQMAVDRFPSADIYVFLTQDAILANDRAIENMVAALVANPNLGMVYGRQLPHKEANELEAHARLFNYPDQSQIRRLEDRRNLGIKTISCSNSFAAYRSTALREAGGFPSGTILGEDVIVAGKMLLNGWEMAYLANSKVYHSHDYSINEEFRRYFDIGVFHSGNRWIFDHFGRAEKEGYKYLNSELSYLWKNNFWLLPKALISILSKFLGYKVGLIHAVLPAAINRRLSMHKSYWKEKKEMVA